MLLSQSGPSIVLGDIQKGVSVWLVKYLPVIISQYILISSHFGNIDLLTSLICSRIKAQEIDKKTPAK